MKDYGVKFSNKICGRPISAFPASLCPLRLNVHARILTHQKLTQRTQRRSGRRVYQVDRVLGFIGVSS